MPGLQSASSRRIRIAFVSHSFPPVDAPESNLGGMQRVATELFEAFQRHPEIELTPQVLRTSWKWTHVRTGPFLASSFARLKRLVQQGQIDAVLFSSMVTATLAIPLRKHLTHAGVTAAAIVHGRDVTLPGTLYQKLVPRVLDALDLVLPVSRATGEACTSRGLLSARCRVVPNGIQLDRFKPGVPGSRRDALQSAFPKEASALPADSLLLCSVGRQVERKGFAWFTAHVMPALPENVHFWLAGDGPERTNIQGAIDSAGLNERVRLLGRIGENQLHALYRGADLFVMPNIPVPGDMEGFGVVMLEAGLNGLPTIGADLEGIADVVATGQNGFLVPTGDSQAFAGAIQRFIERPGDLAALSDRAANYVSTHFSWDAVAGKYIDAMRQARIRPSSEQA